MPEDIKNTAENKLPNEALNRAREVILKMIEENEKTDEKIDFIETKPVEKPIETISMVAPAKENDVIISPKNEIVVAKLPGRKDPSVSLKQAEKVLKIIDSVEAQTEPVKEARKNFSKKIEDIKKKAVVNPEVIQNNQAELENLKMRLKEVERLRKKRLKKTVKHILTSDLILFTMILAVIFLACLIFIIKAYFSGLAI